MLKHLLIGTVAMVLLATAGGPALAQKYDPEIGSGNVVKGPGGAPVTPDTAPYVGQRSGEAYNYDAGGTHCRVVIRHEWRHGRRIAVHRRTCS